MYLEGDNLKRYTDLREKLQGVESWRERALICDPEASLHEPAKESEIKEAEEKLGLELPDELKSIYSESDGIFMNTGANTVMRIRDLVYENLDLRDPEGYDELYMPFNNLLFFGGAGNGDLWAFGIKMNGDIDTLNIYGWNHEDDGRPCVASSILDMFILLGSKNLYDVP